MQHPGTPGIAGTNFGSFGGGGTPFGGVYIEPDQTPDSFGGVFDAAGDAIQDTGAGEAFLSELGVNLLSGGTPQRNQRLNFSAPSGSGPPVQPEQASGGTPLGWIAAGVTALLAVLLATDTI